jgi:hypothetical protein
VRRAAEERSQRADNIGGGGQLSGTSGCHRARLCRDPWVRDLNIASPASEDLLKSLRVPNVQGVHFVEIIATFSFSVTVEEQCRGI